MAHVPVFAQQYLQTLPSTWDETRFIDGFPGKLFVVARKSGNKWYVAGINGEGIAKDLNLDLSFLKNKKGQLMSDDEQTLLKETPLKISSNLTKITVKPNGGFVAVFE